MNDCPNADVRDLLPDLLHGRLDAPTRALVESHLEGCADCRAELALLRDLRASLGRTPALNIAAIAAAVPAYRAPARRSWVGWRTAAAITVLAAGGSSLVVMRRNVSPVPGFDCGGGPVCAQWIMDRHPPATATASCRHPCDSAAGCALINPGGGVAPARRDSVTAPATDRRELALAGGSLTDLSDRELASLLKDIESLDALPSTDVENVPISPIAPSAPRSPRRGAP